MAQRSITQLPSKLTTAALIDLYKFGVKAVTAPTPQGRALWQKFVMNTPALARYGFNNMVVVFAQNQEATFIQSYSLWDKTTRHVQNGARANAVYLFNDQREMNPEPFFDIEDTYDIEKGKRFMPPVGLERLSSEQRIQAFNALDPDGAGAGFSDAERLKRICRKAVAQSASEKFPQQTAILYGIIVAAILSVCKFTNEAEAFCQTSDFKYPENFGPQSMISAPAEFVALMHKAVELIRLITKNLSESAFYKKTVASPEQVPVTKVNEEVNTSNAAEDDGRKERSESDNQGSGAGTAGVADEKQSDASGLLRDERAPGGASEGGQQAVRSIASDQGDPDPDEHGQHTEHAADSGSEQQDAGTDVRTGDDTAPVVSTGTDEAGLDGILHGAVSMALGVSSEPVSGSGEAGSSRVSPVGHVGDRGSDVSGNDGRAAEEERKSPAEPESTGTDPASPQTGSGITAESQEKVAVEPLTYPLSSVEPSELSGKVIILPTGIDSQEYKVNTMSDEVSFSLCLTKNEEIRGPLQAFTACLRYDAAGQCVSVSVSGGEAGVCEAIAQIVAGSRHPEKLFRYDNTGSVQSVGAWRIKTEAGAQLKLYKEYERSGHPLTTAVLQARRPPVVQVMEEDQTGMIEEVLNHCGIPDSELNSLISGQTRIDMLLGVKLNQIFSTGTPDEWIEWDKQYVRWRDKATALASLRDLVVTPPHSERAKANASSEPEKNRVAVRELSMSSIAEELEGQKMRQSRFDANIKAVRTLKAFLAEGRIPTDDEREIVNGYSGWQGLSEMFSQTGQNKANYDLLTEIFTPEEFEKAKAESAEDISKTQEKIITPVVQEELVRLGFIQGESS